jgi:hypothetical protein
VDDIADSELDAIEDFEVVGDLDNSRSEVSEDGTETEGMLPASTCLKNAQIYANVLA